MKEVMVRYGGNSFIILVLKGGGKIRNLKLSSLVVKVSVGFELLF